MSAEPLHLALWKRNRGLSEECLAHPFVSGLAEGTLEREAFRRYVAQDALFLRAFFSAYALAAARAVGTPEAVTRLHRLMGGVLDELRLHRGYAERWSIDLDDVRPLPATRAYTDFLLRTAWTADAGEILAAMTPCMRLYAFLGQALAGRSAPESLSRNPYREWIETYSSDEFEGLAVELEGLLDSLADDVPEVASAYGYAVRCELDFFSASLTNGSA